MEEVERLEMDNVGLNSELLSLIASVHLEINYLSLCVSFTWGGLDLAFMFKAGQVELKGVESG